MPKRTTRNVYGGERQRRVVESVRRATLAELARAGFSGLQIQTVAREAGVHRTTIYRRWPTKEALLTTLVQPIMERYESPPETGTLGGDLLAVMGVVCENLDSPEGRAITRVFTSNRSEIAQLAAEVTDGALASFHVPFERARLRGELPEEADVEAMVHLAFFGLVNWSLHRNLVPSEADCARLGRIVLAPVAAHVSLGPLPG